MNFDERWKHSMNVARIVGSIFLLLLAVIFGFVIWAVIAALQLFGMM